MMPDTAETTSLLEGGLEEIKDAAKYLKNSGISHKIAVAGDGVPGT